MTMLHDFYIPGGETEEGQVQKGRNFGSSQQGSPALFMQPTRDLVGAAQGGEVGLGGIPDPRTFPPLHTPNHSPGSADSLAVTLIRLTW